MGREPEQTPLPGDIQRASSYLRKCSTSLTLRETQMLSTGQVVTSGGEDVERKEPSPPAGGKVNWCRHCGKQNGRPSKN